MFLNILHILLRGHINRKEGRIKIGHKLIYLSIGLLLLISCTNNKSDKKLDNNVSKVDLMSSFKKESTKFINFCTDSSNIYAIAITNNNNKILKINNNRIIDSCKIKNSSTKKTTESKTIEATKNYIYVIDHNTSKILLYNKELKFLEYVSIPNIRPIALAGLGGDKIAISGLNEEDKSINVYKHEYKKSEDFQLYYSTVNFTPDFVNQTEKNIYLWNFHRMTYDNGILHLLFIHQNNLLGIGDSQLLSEFSFGIVPEYSKYKKVNGIYRPQNSLYNNIIVNNKGDIVISVSYLKNEKYKPDTQIIIIDDKLKFIKRKILEYGTSTNINLLSKHNLITLRKDSTAIDKYRIDY